MVHPDNFFGHAIGGYIGRGGEQVRDQAVDFLFDGLPDRRFVAIIVCIDVRRGLISRAVVARRGINRFQRLKTVLHVENQLQRPSRDRPAIRFGDVEDVEVFLRPGFVIMVNGG